MFGLSFGGRIPFTGFWIPALFMVVLFAQPIPSIAQDSTSLAVLSRVNLREVQAGRLSVIVPMGAGITVKLTRPEDSILGQSLRIMHANRVVYKEDEGGAYESAALYKYGDRFYLVVGSYSGGAHCCGGYLICLRNDSTTGWIHVGEAGGENGGPMNASQVLFEHDGKIWLRTLNNDFDGFHSGHAQSSLINAFPEFWEIRDTGGVRRERVVFRDNYLSEVLDASNEIKAALRVRKGVPEAILDSGGDFEDEVGQLLVRRAVLTIYAGEIDRAKSEFMSSVKQMYRSAAGAEKLWAELSSEAEGQ